MTAKLQKKMEYPIEIKGKTIKQVRKLNLSGKNLKFIPDNVFQYTNLEKLDLSKNRIEISVWNCSSILMKTQVLCFLWPL